MNQLQLTEMKKRLLSALPNETQTSVFNLRHIASIMPFNLIGQLIDIWDVKLNEWVTAKIDTYHKDTKTFTVHHQLKS